MFNTSQVLLRNLQQLKSTPTFVLNPPPDDLLRQIECVGSVLTWDYPTYQHLQSQGITGVEFAPNPSSLESYAQALLFMPKSQAEFALWWRMACAKLTVGCVIWLVGEKREGIANAAKHLEAQGISLTKLDSARHCQLWRVLPEQPCEAPSLESFYQYIELDCDARRLKVASLPGVFGAGRLDEGTRLLLEHLGEIPKGRVLDFGCGSGVLGACLKVRQPYASVELIDVHALALASARRTLSLNGLDGLVYPADSLSGLNGRFQAIYTNPPFHTGVKIDYRVTAQMIRQAWGKLEQGGELRLVANAFLPYPNLIQEIFGHCELAAHTAKFKVYRAVRD